MGIIGGGIGLYYYKTHYISASLKKYEQTEITGILNRSECGWYQLYSYYLRPNTELTTDELYIETNDETNYQYRLALLEFNLANYTSGKLDNAAKNNIRTVLKLFSNTKIKVIIRFLYDWDGQGKEKEPDDIKWIQKHMTQTGKLLNEYKDIIYTTQGIFVGSWAEMHDSKYLSTKDMTTLLLHFASVTDSSIYLAVRTPEQYRTILNEYNDHPNRYKKYNISTKELEARLGLFNDGMLGSISDIGTYHKADVAVSESEKNAIRKNELDFQNNLSIHTPNGGEVVNDNSFNDSENAIKDLAKMHISYLNQMHDETVINKWKNSTYDKKNSIYDGYSAYDYITEHMGARFVLRDCSLSYEPFQKGDASGSITIENVGFSNLYHTKDFTLSLVNTKTKKSTTLISPTMKDSYVDPCQWNSGQKIAISFSFSPFKLEDGTYYLLAQLTDPNLGEVLSFANDSFDESLKGYILGEVTIKR